MSDRDYGPLQRFEITWATGHVETIQGHQVSHTGGSAMFGQDNRPPTIHFHGQFDGNWRLVLSALEADIVRVRNVTLTEPSLDGEATS